MRKRLQLFISLVAVVIASVVLFAATANDDFTDVNGTSLTAHTPTGSGAGGTWNVLVGSGTANIQSNHVEETNSGDGNRFRNTADLGFDQMDVQADVTQVTGTPFAGVMGRIPAAASTTGYECKYNFLTGQWELDGPTSSGTPLTQAWPGGAVTIKLVIRTSNISCQANGVTKVTLATNENTGNTRAGVILGNFDGFAPEITVDNYQSSGFSGGGGGTTPKPLPLLGVGEEYAMRLR